MEPVLKWVGGKRQLLPDIKRIIPQSELNSHTLFEPFVGGGAVFLEYEHSSVVINDSNSELINVYNMIKSSPDELIKLLKNHKANHCSDYYYEVRSWDRRESYFDISDVEKAARIIYLNRTCFNGLYRVNSKGYFNVPIGKYANPDIVLEEKIIKVSEYLNRADIKILCGDFADAVSTAKIGDIIYFDPPYDYEANGFTSYTSDSFSQIDLQRLKSICDELVDRGCRILLSNNETDFVKSVFEDSRYNRETVLANRTINSNGKDRGKVKEILIYS